MFPHRVSLLNACLVAHGRPLRKSAQLSNWTIRPLSTEQMEYAALDVLTLPQVLSHLLTEATKSRTKIADLIQ
jgi:ribonuclease D